jgi:hypothetical protein
MNMKTRFYALISISAAIFQCSAGDMTSYVWGPETNNVKMSITAKSGSPHFSLDDINDLSAFIAQLRRQSGPLSTFLWQRLSKEEQLMLINYDASAPNANQVQNVAVNALNRIIDGPSIYTTERLKGIALPKETGDTMQHVFSFNSQLPASPYVSLLNRLLLEGAYPLQLSSKPPLDQPRIRRTEPVILVITLTNMSFNDTFYLPSVRNYADTMYYSFEIMTPSGNRVSPKVDYVGAFLSGTRYTLNGGKARQRTFNFNISDICKFDEIGAYVITVTREVSWPNGEQSGFTVVSNPLTINIVPDK